MPETTGISADPKTAAFLEGLTLIIADLDKARTRDPEVVAMIGSLADRLIADAGTEDWPEVKQSLSADEQHRLVGTFSQQIEAAQGEGNIKIAYALQAVAASLIGSRFSDERVSTGIELLDDFIAAARDYFKRNAPKPN